MVTVIVRDYAHRFLSSGVMVSAPVGKDGTLGKFIQCTPDFLGLSGGQYSEIQEHLNRLTEVFPETERPIPPKPEYVARASEGVVVR